MLRSALAKTGRTARIGLGATALAAGCLGATASLAETRSLSFYNTHTEERATITFKRDGSYDQAGLKQLNHLLRDWRQNLEIRMDPELFDLIWEVYRQTGASEPIHIVCGYRAPETNNMLRSRSRGVAKHSQHMLGKALDFFIPGVDLTKLRLTGMKQQYGGVGIYYGSNFVHMDVGSVRTWPNRLSRDQLLALFPDGKTLHLPADGDPLPGYQIALAEFNRKHPNRGTADWNDEDDVPRPVASATVQVAKAEFQPPAPPPAAASSVRVGADALKPAPGSLFQPATGAFALAQPPVKPDVPRAADAVVALAPLPRSKPQLPGTPLPQDPALPALAAAAGRPSPSAVDALQALTGDTVATGSSGALAYAPPPPSAAAARPLPLTEAADAVVLGRSGKAVVASLSNAATLPALTRGSGIAAPKADRGEPLARLVARMADPTDPNLLSAVPLRRMRDGDTFVRLGADEIDAFLKKPTRVISGSFTQQARATAGFAGPAVVALATRVVE